jgi:hypothetical protein
VPVDLAESEASQGIQHAGALQGSGDDEHAGNGYGSRVAKNTQGLFGTDHAAQ